MKRYVIGFISNIVTLVIGTFVFLKFGWQVLFNPRKMLTTKDRTKPPDVLNDPTIGEHKYIIAGDVRLHYVENGSKDKELMVFLHGFPEFWFSWRHQLKEFSKDYWAVAIDMRGYGDSEKFPDVDSYETSLIAEDVRNLIKALGREKCILVAHDWGGVIGHYFIRKYPEMLHSYILMNTMAPGATTSAVIQNFEQFKKFWYIFLFQIRAFPELLLQAEDLKWIESIFKTSCSKEDTEAYKYNMRNFRQLTGPVNYYRANFLSTKKRPKGPTAEKLNELKVPGLYIHGNNDVALTEDGAYTRSFKDIVPQVKYVNIKEADHFVQLSAPAKVNQSMREFLAGIKTQ